MHRCPELYANLLRIFSNKNLLNCLHDILQNLVYVPVPPVQICPSEL